VLGATSGFFEFDWNVECEVDGNSLDADTITLAASEETIKMHKAHKAKGPLQGSKLEGSTLEDLKLGPGPKPNTGPPFAVGDVIMCDTPRSPCLQRAFVLLADHPKYWPCLENGNTIGAHVSEAWLAPQWEPGKYAGDQNDPFREELSNKQLRMGSYGILVDSQIESLRKVGEAKEFAKAVKANDAEVPT
jgi:hypothetical protein